MRAACAHAAAAKRRSEGHLGALFLSNKVCFGRMVLPMVLARHALDSRSLDALSSSSPSTSPAAFIPRRSYSGVIASPYLSGSCFVKRLEIGASLHQPPFFHHPDSSVNQNARSHPPPPTGAPPMVAERGPPPPVAPDWTSSVALRAGRWLAAAPVRCGSPLRLASDASASLWLRRATPPFFCAASPPPPKASTARRDDLPTTAVRACSLLFGGAAWYRHGLKVGIAHQH